MKKIILLFSLIIIGFTSCEKLYQPGEDPADKFVGKYEVTGILYDEDGYMDDEFNDILHITKVDFNIVHISKFNRNASIENNMIYIEDFYEYENRSFIEYKFTPGIYINNIFSIIITIIENDGYKKHKMSGELIFNKI